MQIDLKSFLSAPVLIYLLVVISGQILLYVYRKKSEEIRSAQREKAGLGERVLVDHSVRLRKLRIEASVDSIVLLLTVLLTPLILTKFSDEGIQELALVFLALFAWLLFTATDVVRQFLGGVAYRALIAFNPPFQVGDRVNLNGYAGKVVDIGIFFLRINTVDDDLVSIPTASLWGQPSVSANAGDRASLCKMIFHLSSRVTKEQRKQTEDAIWDAIQKSVYWDFSKPLQIFVEQQKGEIMLTARAYVALTYNEPLFRSDVYQAFLDFVDEHQVPLADLEIESV